MYLSEILSSIASDYLVLGGDFNLPDVTWRDGQVSDCNSSVLHSTFSHLVSSFGLIQHVTEPTRADSKRSSTLDLLFLIPRQLYPQSPTFQGSVIMT